MTEKVPIPAGEGPDHPQGQADLARAVRVERTATPLFLARQTYRRRRLADAARILPVVAAGLFFLPTLWQPALTPEPDTARGAVWLFSTWAIVILVAVILAWRLGRRSSRRPGGAADREDA